MKDCRHEGGGEVRAKRFEIDRLKSMKCEIEYQQVIKEKVDTHEIVESDEGGMGTVNDKWEKIRDVIRKAAEEVVKISEEERELVQCEECGRITNEKNRARHRMLTRNTRSNRQNYEEKRKIEKGIHRRRKRKIENERVKEMEGDRLANRKFYATINGTRKGFYPRMTACRTKEGELVTDERKKMERWREFFSEHLNNNNKDNNNNNKGRMDASEESTRMAENGDDDSEEIESPTRMELIEAIEALKNNKSPGIDNLPGELIKAGGVEIQQQMERLLTQIWNEKCILEEWKIGICPI